MLSAIIAALLNVAASDLPRSPVADEGHVHDWSTVLVESDGEVAFDLAFEGAYAVGEVSYPTVLFRAIDPEKDGASKYVDFEVAVDCQRAMLLAVDAWMFDGTSDAGEKQPLPNRRFRSVVGFPPPLRKAIFQQACGPDWTRPPHTDPSRPITVDIISEDAP